MKDPGMEPPPPVTQPKDIVAAGKRATSQDRHTSPSPLGSSLSYFDELASDSDAAADFCFDFTDDNPTTNSSAYLTIANACRTIIQLASSSLAALAHQDFTKIKIAL